MNRTQVSVVYETDSNGVVLPKSVQWHDGRIWMIERLLHSCRSPELSFTGIRYTVLIGGLEKYLYHDQEEWYVDAVIEEVHKL